MPVMQQSTAVAPPIWNGPRIPANVFPWQLAGPQNVPMQIHGRIECNNINNWSSHNNNSTDNNTSNNNSFI